MEAFSVFATLSLADMISGPLGMVREAMNGVTGAAGSLGSSMGNLALAMAPVALAAAAVLGALGLLSTAGLATEKALAELATLGVKDLNAVEEAARQASNSMAGLTKEQFITAAYDIKSGISSLSDEGVAAFTALAAKTAQATKATVADMTNLGATAYGIHKRMYAQLSDADFGAMLYAGVASSVQAFKTTGAAMNSAMSNLGAAATQANRPLEEQLAVLGTLQNSMEASVAGTAYKSFFRDASKGFKELGIEAVDAHGQMRAMPDLLEALEKKLGPLTQAKLDNLTKAFGSETGAMIQNLLGKSGELRASTEAVKEAMKGGVGFLNAMAASVNAGLGPTLGLLRQSTQNLAEELAKHLSPGVTVLTASLVALVLRMQEAAKNPFVGFMLRLVGGIAAGIVALTGLSAGIWFMTNAAGMLGKALAPLKMALLGLSWPVVALVAGAALLYAAYRNNFGGMADMVDKFARTVSLVVRGVIQIFQNLSGESSELRGELGREIEAAGLFDLVVNVAKVVYRIKEFFAGIWDGLNFDGAISVLTPAILVISDLFSRLGALIGSVFGKEVKGAAAEAYSFGQMVGTVLSVALEALATVLALLVNWFAMFAQGVSFIISIFTGDLPSAAGAFRAFVDGIGQGWAMVGDLFGVGDAIRETWAKIMAFFDSINLFESGAKLMSTLAEGVKSMFMAPYNAVYSGLQMLRKLLPFSDAQEGPLSTLTLSGTRIMTTLSQGVDAGKGALLGTMTEVLGSVGSSVSNWWSGIFGDKQEVPGMVPPSVPLPTLPEALAESVGGALTVSDPRLPDPPAFAADDTDLKRRGQGAGTGDKSGNSWTLHIGNITLPSVTNGQSFIDELRDAATEMGEVMA